MTSCTDGHPNHSQLAAIGAFIQTAMPATIDQERTDAEKVIPPRSGTLDLAEAMRQDLTNYNGGSIVFGIMLAGGAYPIVLAAIYLMVGFAFVIWNWFSGYPFGNVWEEIGSVFAFLVAGGVFCAFIGVVWAAIASALTMPVVYLFLRSLRVRGTLVGLGAASGGLVGFVALLPITLTLPWSLGMSDVALMAIILALGPALTTILGQIGGAWGARRAVHFARFADANAIAAESLELSEAMGWRTFDRVSDTNSAEPRLQFSIRHLLWIFVWLSLVLSVIKLCRLPFEFVLPVLVGWFFYQLATLRIGFYLARRLGPWWVNWRRRRST
jgi:hypothetical protein